MSAQPGAPHVSRLERFGRVDSTQRIVGEWLSAGQPEVAVAVADEQLAGRGRAGRTWTAPTGTALLLSLGLRPTGLPIRHGWRLAAIAALAMVEAADSLIGKARVARSSRAADSTRPPPRDRLLLKWPNDIVVDDPGAPGGVRKLAGLLGETVAGDAGSVQQAVVGVGTNVDWDPADFPADLAPGMTSLRALAGGPVDRDVLLDAFLTRFLERYDELRRGTFDGAAWSALQVTTGRAVDVETGREPLAGHALGVDPDTGALLVESAGGNASVDAGEVVRCRLVVASAARSSTTARIP